MDLPPPCGRVPPPFGRRQRKQVSNGPVPFVPAPPPIDVSYEFSGPTIETEQTGSD